PRVLRPRAEPGPEHPSPRQERGRRGGDRRYREQRDVFVRMARVGEGRRGEQAKKRDLDAGAAGADLKWKEEILPRLTSIRADPGRPGVQRPWLRRVHGSLLPLAFAGSGLARG